MKENFREYFERIEQELEAALPHVCSTDNDDRWTKSAFGQLYPNTESKPIQALKEPCRTLVSLGGKRWRPLFLVLVAEGILEKRRKDGNLAPKDVEEGISLAFHLTPLVEFIHTASLIHDDIEDKSDTRRGKPAAYITYGMDMALNSGSWLYFVAPQCIDTLNADETKKLNLFRAYALECRRLHLGQAMDITWHNDNSNYPTPAQYLDMVRYKTGTLSSLSARIGCLASGADEHTTEELCSAAAKIGAGFQIIDDVINLTSGNPGKKRGDDIVEGKKSLPVLHFIEKCGASSEKTAALMSYLSTAQKDGIDSPAVEQAIALLEEEDVIARSSAEGLAYINEGCDYIAELLGAQNPATDKIHSLFINMVPEQFILKNGALQGESC